MRTSSKIYNSATGFSIVAMLLLIGVLISVFTVGLYVYNKQRGSITVDTNATQTVQTGCYEVVVPAELTIAKDESSCELYATLDRDNDNKYEVFIRIVPMNENNYVDNSEDARKALKAQIPNAERFIDTKVGLYDSVVNESENSTSGIKRYVRSNITYSPKRYQIIKKDKAYEANAFYMNIGVSHEVNSKIKDLVQISWK